MEALDLVQLRPLLALTQGSPQVRVGILDGPVALNQTAFAQTAVIEFPGARAPSTSQSPACRHGTAVMAVLAAERISPAPALCPGCTFVLRPIFPDEEAQGVPFTTSDVLAKALLDCLHTGVHIINLSVAFVAPALVHERALEEVLALAAQRQVLVVVAAGNQGLLSGSPLTRHPWVIPVVAYNSQGAVMERSNLGLSVGKRGVGGPGEGVTSLDPQGRPHVLGGTSAAAAFVTGALALLRSLVPAASAPLLRAALLPAERRSVAPPLLNAAHSYAKLMKVMG